MSTDQSGSDEPSATPPAPRVWLLLGHKAGDNTQIRTLADALGWPCTIKRMVYRPTELLSNLLLGPNLRGIRREASDALEPPWPDLVITAGRRNEPVARWIQQQSAGQTRLVHVGRPWARLERFDLIVTTPQYTLPERANILHNTLPLHAVTRERLDQVAAQWRPRLADLPRPYIAVLVGGDSGPFVFDAPKAACLGRSASRLAQQLGGSLLVTTSARTPSGAVDALRDSIDCPAQIFEWRPNAEDNPYHAYLGLADRIIVTGESVSMLTEACATGRPVDIFDLTEGPSAMRPCARMDGPAAWMRGLRNTLRWKRLSHLIAMALGPRRMRRDVRVMQRALIAQGRAAWLGHEPPGGVTGIEDDDLQRAVERVRRLMSEMTESIDR
jgi:hypothetical protein